MSNHDFKSHLINGINANIDIPMIDENTEKKTFNALYDTILNVLENI